MGRVTVSALYRVSQPHALALNRYATPYFEEGSDERNARLGDKVQHIQGTAAVLGSTGAGSGNRVFTFTLLGVDPPCGGAGQVNVGIKRNGTDGATRQINTVDYTLSFDHGEDASTADTSNPTRAGSSLTFLKNIGDTDYVVVDVY